MRLSAKQSSSGEVATGSGISSASLKVVVAGLMVASLLACTAPRIMVKQNGCRLAPVKDGWVAIESAPAGIAYQRSEVETDARLLWFEDGNGRVMACERPRPRGRCGERGQVFEQISGQWVREPIPVIEFCTD